MIKKPMTTDYFITTSHFPFPEHQSLPCVKGGGPPKGGSEGLAVQDYGFAGSWAKWGKPPCINPSVSLR